MAPSARRLILYTYRQPTMFIDGSNGTNDQVTLACKAAISSFIAVCQHKYWSASLKLRGSKAEGNITRGAETSREGAEAELMLAIFCCLGRSTMGCCRMGGRAEGGSMEVCCGREYVERSTHKSRSGKDRAKCPDREKDVDNEAVAEGE